MWVEKTIDHQSQDPSPKLKYSIRQNNVQSDTEKHLASAIEKMSLDEAYHHLLKIFPMPEYVLYRGGHLITLYRTDMRQHHHIGLICTDNIQLPFSVIQE